MKLIKPLTLPTMTPYFLTDFCRDPDVQTPFACCRLSQIEQRHSGSNNPALAGGWRGGVINLGGDSSSCPAGGKGHQADHVATGQVMSASCS